MLRRFCPLRTPVVRTSQHTSRPVYELLYAKLGSSSTDSSSPKAAQEVALLHRHSIFNLGCWKDASNQVKNTLRESSPEGQEAAKILDEALEIESVDSSAAKILIAYGSQTGTAEALARMAGLFAKSTSGLDPVVVTLNDAVSLLKSDNHKFAASLIMCSTYGIGDTPTNATKFLSSLEAGELNEAFQKIPHTVFGLGNSQNNDNFNAAAKRISKKLQDLGSESLVAPIYSCEMAQEGHDSLYRTWKSAVWSTLAKKNIGSGNKTATLVDTYEASQCIAIKGEKKHLNLRRTDWFEAPVTYNEVVSAKGYEPRFHHMIAELDLRKTQEILGRKLKTTDQLVVQPHNPKEYVDRALKVFGLSGEEVFDITPLPGSPVSWFDGHKLTARMIFSEVIDLSGIPSRSALSSLICAAQNEAEKADLERLSNDMTGNNEYSQLVAPGKVFTVIDVLERFPSLKLNLSQALTRLPKISVRYYSNSHDVSTMSNKFEVIYNVPARHDNGKNHLGLATSGMEACVPAASSLWCSLEEGKTVFPATDVPALFVGLGSGIGLVRGALQARAAVKAAGEKIGKAILIYGFHEEGKDQLFKDEIEQMVKDGVIDDVRLVASHAVKGTFKNPFAEIDTKMAKFITDSKASVFYTGPGGSVPRSLEDHLRRKGINVAQMKKNGTFTEEYFNTSVDAENLMKLENATNPNSQATLAEKFGDAEMFCFQCEQTKCGSKGGFGVAGCTKVGVCGKTPSVAALQDLTVYYTQVMSFYLDAARAQGAPENAKLNRLTLFGYFTTLTNVNFEDARFVELLKELHGAILEAKTSYEAFCADKGVKPVAFPEDQMVIPNEFDLTNEELVAAGRAVGVLSRFTNLGAQDAASVNEIVLYGMKGVAAYADHGLMNNKENPEIYAYLHKAAAYLIGKDRFDLGKSLELALECGKVNLLTMGQLYESHSSKLGVPSPAVVSCKPKPGKCICVSGHDLIILEKLLPLCEKEGINVYTHGEMLPAHSYEGLRKYKSLAGQFGTAWMNQYLEFPHFPGSILMTTNCIQDPSNYKGRMFTVGAVGWEGVNHLGKDLSDINFEKLIQAAKDAPGFTEADKEFTYPDPIGFSKRPASHTVGFGHETILGIAPKIIEEIGKGNISRFSLIGGCDGQDGVRSYFTDLARELPDTSVILTLGCSKFRMLPLAEELGTIPGDSGIPRVLDMGQCNDSFSAVQVAVALAGALKCEVSDLPLSIVLSWLEQKAVAVLLSCLHLGLKPLRIGPNLPGFVTPNVLKVLVEQFGVRPVGVPAEDAKAICSAKSMAEDLANVSK